MTMSRLQLLYNNRIATIVKLVDQRQFNLMFVVDHDTQSKKQALKCRIETL